MVVSISWISPSLQLDILMLITQQQLYLSPVPGTAKLFNHIYMKMKPQICVGSERVKIGCEIKPVFYLGQFKRADHAGKEGIRWAFAITKTSNHGHKYAHAQIDEINVSWWPSNHK